MLSRVQFSEQIVAPSLKHMGLWSKSAEQLVLGTSIVESHLTWLVQLGSGPAKGLFQVEPNTVNDLYSNYLPYRPDLLSLLNKITIPSMPRETQLVYNLWYSAAICRLLYFRHPEALPEAGDIAGHANYWKKYYNTSAGKGNPQNYIDAWNNVLVS